MEENRPIENEVKQPQLSENTLKELGSLFEGANEWQEFFEEVLKLPDDEFIIISPSILEVIGKSFNDTNTRLLLSQTLNSNGYNASDIVDGLKDNLDAIDQMENYSQVKKDFIKSSMVIIANAINETEGVAKKIMEIPIELGENAKIPAYATDGSAALDLYSPAEYTIKPGETVLIPVNIKVALPKGYAFLIHPRSGLSLKSKLRICNSIGLIDSDYKNTIGVIIENVEPNIKDFELTEDGRVQGIVYGQSYTIGAGERFAQMRLVEVPKAAFYEVSSVADMGDDRGGGFGHTGKE